MEEQRKSENALVPALRFEGFSDPWEQRKVGDYLVESRERGSSGDVAKKLTVKLWGKGVTEKAEISGSAHTQYYVRHAGQFIYSKLDFLNAAFGVIPDNLDEYESTADLPAFDVSNLDARFLLLKATQRSFYLRYGTIADGSRKAKRIHSEAFLAMPLFVPADIEQTRIATLFARLDSLIALHQRKHEKLKTVKQSLLEKMFPKEGEDVPEIRFEGFTDPWEQRTFDEFVYASGSRNADNLDLESHSVSNTSGFVPQSEQFENGGTMAEADKTAYWIVEPGSFAYNPARINVGSIGYLATRENVIVSSLYEVFRSDETCDDRFLWHWLKSALFAKQIEALQEGGVRLYFFFDKLLKSEITMPSIREQSIIGSLFDRLDSLIALHQRERSGC